MERNGMLSIGNTPGWFSWIFGTGSSESAAIQTAQNLPASNYKALPDYDSWDIGDSAWTCSQWVQWHQAMNEHWGTRAANYKFLVCWAAKPASFSPCGSNEEFYTYFDGVGLDLRSAQAQASGYANMLQSFVPSTPALIFGAVAIGGIYAATKFVDFGVEKKKTTLTPQKIGLGIAGAAVLFVAFEAWYKGGKYKDYQTGTHPNSYSGVPLALYIERRDRITIGGGGSVTVPQEILNYWSAAKGSDTWSQFYVKEFNSLKDFLIIPSTASWN